MIRSSGGVAFVLRRASGLALTLYLVVWLVRLPEGPLLPFGSDLGRRGGTLGKALLIALITLLTAHALEGLTQVAVERWRLMHRRGFLLTVALVMAALVGGFHFLLFFGGGPPP